MHGIRERKDGRRVNKGPERNDRRKRSILKRGCGGLDAFNNNRCRPSDKSHGLLEPKMTTLKRRLVLKLGAMKFSSDEERI